MKRARHSLHVGVGLVRRGWLCLLAASAFAAPTLAAPPTASATYYGVMAWGENYSGQLGDGREGPETNSYVPVAVEGLKEVTAIAGGQEQSLALLKHGTVMAWGGDYYGQLGDGREGPETNSDVPVEVKGLKEVTAIAAGSDHSLALLKNGTVMAWGNNEFGQLGDGEQGEAHSSDVPVEVKGLKEVTAIAAGRFYSLALLKNGTVMAWGNNELGQLGDGQHGGAYATDVPVEVEALTEVTAIAAGSQHSLALLKNGTVMAWGNNQSGQLGEGNIIFSDVPVEVEGLTEVTAIAGGQEQSLALLKDGTVMAWGNNSAGELGDGNTTNSDVPVEVEGLKEVTAIAGGIQHSLALTALPAVCSGDDGTVTLSPGLTNTAAEQTVKVKGTLTGCVNEPFTEAKYTAKLTTAGAVSCSALTGPGEPASGTVKYKLAPKTKRSGTFEIALSEASGMALSSSLESVPFLPVGISGTVTEAYYRGITCGVPLNGKPAKPVTKGTFTGSAVDFE
jgi:Regulator of chromosome condensation (RCC1) repeat